MVYRYTIAEIAAAGNLLEKRMNPCLMSLMKAPRLATRMRGKVDRIDRINRILRERSCSSFPARSFIYPVNPVYPVVFFF